jgi:hypothetical protein
MQSPPAIHFRFAAELALGACIGSEQFVYWNAKDPRRCLAPDAFVKLGKPDRSVRGRRGERGIPELGVEILSESDDGPTSSTAMTSSASESS